MRYLSEISDTIREYHAWSDNQVEIATKWDEVRGTLHQLTNWESVDKDNLIHTLIKLKSKWEDQLDLLQKILEGWDDLFFNYAQDELEVQVRGSQ